MVKTVHQSLVASFLLIKFRIILWSIFTFTKLNDINLQIFYIFSSSILLFSIDFDVCILNEVQIKIN